MPLTTQANPTIETSRPTTLQPATVNVVETISETDSNSLFQDVGPFFTDYMIQCRYEKDYHRYMLGITKETGFEGNKAAFVQLASPTLLYVVDWTGAAADEIPNVPNPSLGDSNWVLLAEHWEPAPVSATPEGDVPIYRLSGVFIFGHKNPSSDVKQDITIPKMPWIREGFERQLSANNLDSSILESTGGGAGSGGSSSSTGGTIAPGILQPNPKTIDIKTSQEL